MMANEFQARAMTAWRRRVIAAVCGLTLAAVAGAQAQAQAQAQTQTQTQTQATPAATGAGAGDTTAAVGEIVVQAERRDEVLRDVPAAVTAETGAAITAMGPISSNADFLDQVPSLQYTNLGDPVNSEISIRGSGTERATGADTSVGLYFDGVFIPGRVLQPIDSFDLDHVEVLEGPQGALYGRDSEYGTVNLLPQQPTFSNSGYVDETYNFALKRNTETGVVNYKIDDKWAVRIGAQGIEQSGGFYYNPDRNSYYDTEQGYLLRGQVRYQNQDFDANLLVQRQQMQVPSFASADTIAPKNTTTGYPGIATAPDGFDENPWAPAHGNTDYSKVDVNQVVLNLNYDFHWAKLHSVTSWRQTDTVYQIDSSYLDLASETALQALGEKGSWPYSQTSDPSTANTYSEDLHLDGAPVLDGKLTWLAGLELLDAPQSGNTTATTNPCATSAAPNPVVGEGLCTGTPTNEICVPVLPGSNCSKETFKSPFGADLAYKETYYSYAPYGSLSIKPGWGFRLDGAVRYSYDHKTAAANQTTFYTNLEYPFLTGGTFTPENEKFQKGQFTYAATLSWKIPYSPWDDMLYTKVGTGYRVGGFNLGESPPLLPVAQLPKGDTANVFYAPEQATPIYNDETDTSYEVGFKGAITSHAYFTFDAYYEVTDNELAAVGDGCLATNQCEAGNTNYTVNSGRVDGSGLEASLNTAWDVAGGHLGLQLDGSSQTAKVVYEPKLNSNGEPEVGLPLVGSPISENPRWLANVTLNYSHPVTDDVKVFFNALYHGSWGGIMDPETTSGVVYALSNYNLVNLRTGIDYKSLEFAVIIDNLTNDIYKLHVFGQAGANTVTGLPEFVESQERLSSPQTVALEASYKW
jgi:iron complex outermembrane receptor protein